MTKRQPKNDDFFVPDNRFDKKLKTGSEAAIDDLEKTKYDIFDIDEDSSNKKKKKSDLSDEEGDRVEPEVEETADEKRLRLAKEYLNKIQELSSDTAEINKNLRNLEKGARSDRVIADKLFALSAPPQPSIYRGHKLAATSVALSRDESTAYTGSKDGTILQWDVETGKKIRLGEGTSTKTDRNKQVLALSVSQDGRFLASGGTDSQLHIWDTRNPKSPIKTFTDHRKPINGLSFMKLRENLLFSGSDDRTLKLWNIDEMTYVDTFYGHQSEITSVDAAFGAQYALTGGSDFSCRYWKVLDETQLLFRSNASIDSARFLSNDVFVSGSQDGQLSVWRTTKKVPIVTVEAAHPRTDGRGNGSGAQWITSVATCPKSDLIASGSSDDYIRFWKFHRKSLTPILTVPMRGVVNDLVIAESGRFAVAAVGKEPRLGRWYTMPDGFNGLAVVPLLSLLD